jgi:Flp pilus assembly protein CpaB
VGTSRRILDLVRWHRRGLAAVLAGVVVFAGLSAVTRTDAADLVTVVVTTRLVSAGSTVTRDDVKLARLPSPAVPEGALTLSQDAIGRVAGTGIRTGQILTDLTLIGGAASDGSVVLSVRLDNPELASLAPPGTRVTLFATTSAEPVASHVLVVAIPAVENGGILGGTASKVLLVRVTPDEAGRITRALSSSTLTLAIG